MMQRFTAWFPVMLLAAFAALTFWLDRQVQPADYAGGGKARHDPDYIVENLSAVRVGAQGIPRYDLKARRMVHYPDDDATYLESPTLVSYPNATVTVTATSKNAMLSSNGEEAYLTDDVRLVRASAGDPNDLKMETSFLHVIPDKNLAETDKPVKIWNLNSLTTSIGLELNTETRILKLLSNVRSTYEKPKPAP